ncbi:class A beta-lactamase [Tahibacter soli]|uniref:beta-lactamase n=1 Tax=Tahibacter soli TaxID=2983605 RepID=A0A9X3YRB1_9GAMM|nr:class A beta-lactamase [Tahibacter soli]MDC8015663.1 class A beta-lactamase [Tahibacter soli]
MIDRRHFLRIAGGTLALVGGGIAAGAAWAKPAAVKKGILSTESIAQIERASGGRLGVAVLDTQTGERFAYRDGERFAMCSTFKFLLATAVLKQVDLGHERLERLIPIAQSDLVPHAPLAEKRVGQGATVQELCEATMIFSDNAAANLLLPIVGGPAGLTRFARDIGDTVTRLDRDEPELGSAIPGDDRDTTSPRAMVDNLERIVLGKIVDAASRERVTGWLKDNRTGDKRLRAGLPKGWAVGDKTGAGANGTTNDIAVIWPTGRKPVLIAAYLTETKLDDDGRNGVHVSVAQELAKALAG